LQTPNFCSFPCGSSLLCLHNWPSSPACCQHCWACVGMTALDCSQVQESTNKPNALHRGFANLPSLLAQLASFHLAHPLETLINSTGNRIYLLGFWGDVIWEGSLSLCEELLCLLFLCWAVLRPLYPLSSLPAPCQWPWAVGRGWKEPGHGEFAALWACRSSITPPEISLWDRQRKLKQTVFHNIYLIKSDFSVPKYIVPCLQCWDGVVI